MKTLSRRELYDLVWSKPVTALAKEFEISDVAIHKACRKHRVPTPGLGYWAKIAAGKPVKKTPFHEITDEGLNKIRFMGSLLQSLPPEVKTARATAKVRAKEDKERASNLLLEPPYADTDLVLQSGVED